MERKIKKLIIILIVIILLLSIILLFYIKGNLNNSIDFRKNNTKYTYDPPVETPIVIEASLNRVSNRNNYYVVKEIIDKFFGEYNKLFVDNVDDKVKAKVYGMLDKKYIDFVNTEEENIDKKIDSMIGNSKVQINDMYCCQKDENISVYFIKCNYREKNALNDKISNIMVITDMLNRTYSVLLEDYVKEKFINIKIGGDADMTNIPSMISSNNYNNFNFKVIMDKEYVSNIFEDFKYNLENDLQKAYNSLSDEYKNLRFKNINDFQLYVNNNDFTNASIQKYKINNYDGYVQYLCMYGDDNYFIINETATMKYNILLDTYTIDLPQFLEMYNNENDATKVAMNLEKIKSALNQGDYNYIYNKLDNEYKQKEFSSYSKFEQYIKNQFYSKNEFEYKDVKLENNYYVVNIFNKNMENQDNKYLTIKVYLQENTNYIIKF